MSERWSKHYNSLPELGSKSLGNPTYHEMTHGRNDSVHLPNKHFPVRKDQCLYCGDSEGWKRLYTHLRLSAVCKPATGSASEQSRGTPLGMASDPTSYNHLRDEKAVSMQHPPQQTSTELMLHHHLPHLNSPPSPSMLKLFRCSTTEQVRAQADQELAALVVSAVINAPTERFS